MCMYYWKHGLYTKQSAMSGGKRVAAVAQYVNPGGKVSRTGVLIKTSQDVGRRSYPYIMLLL